VVTGKNRVHHLRDDGIVIAYDAGKQRLAPLHLADEVLAELVFHRASLEAAAKFALLEFA
jgi:hypothetical protein